MRKYKVVLLNGEIYHVGEWESEIAEIDGEDIELNPLPTGAIVDEIELDYSEEFGFSIPGTPKKYSELDKLRADLVYLSIMTGVDI